MMKINNLNIDFVEFGSRENPVLVFAHGLGGNLNQWSSQFECFREHFYIISFSLQGHGRSGRPAVPEAYSLTGYAETAIGLLNALNVDQCIWVGNSMGGVVGYEVIKQRPGLINRIITNGTAPSIIYSRSALKTVYIADHLLIKLLGFRRYLTIAVNAVLKDSGKRKELLAIFLESSPYTVITSHQLLGNYDYVDVIGSAAIPVTFICTPEDRDINKAIRNHEERLRAMPHV